MLRGKEKIWFLVNRLIGEREITAEGKPIGLHPANDLNRHYEHMDVINLLEKLEKENAAKLLSLPTDQNYLKYQVELLPGFDKYVEKLEEDPEYLDWSGKKPKRKGYFSPDNRVDFTKGKEQNKDKYISVGQIEELQKMPEDERNRVMKSSLTEKHIKDAEEYKETSQKLVDDILKNFKLELPNFTEPVLSDVSFALPPNYEAEQVGLLRQLVEQQNTTGVIGNKSEALRITYSKSRQVLLNEVFQLSQPTLNGENDLVFGFLVSHPNTSYSKKRLEDELKIKITKPLHKIVENLGFKGDLAKAFFSTSKNDIIFRNPVSTSELEQIGISKIRLNKPNNS